MIEMGKKYQTRDGRAVRILCVDFDSRKTGYSVVGSIREPDGSEVVGLRDADGRFQSSGPYPEDYIPVPTKHEEWRLRERSGFIHSYRYDTKAEADSERADGEVVVRITWED
jgi:hypothetical protein